MLILGIETSCDETASSIVKAEEDRITILSNVVSSQIKLHSKWGGVVPNLAAREHLKNIIPVLNDALEKAKVEPREIDLIAVANGPGLIPALMIGTQTAKTLSYLWKKPLIGIHHIEGHIYANFISNKIGVNSKFEIRNSKLFPILCLVVSGGHTQLVLMKKHLDYKIIGETLDDAAGEAFDKVARILNLGYPGGPNVAQKALEFKNKKSPPKADQLASLSRSGPLAEKIKIEKEKILNTKYEMLDTTFPRPMINSNNFNFSFSGLKTAVLYETKKHPVLLKNKLYVRELCHEFQQSVCDVLISKTIAAAKKYKPKTIMLAGGVSANLELRKQLGEAIKINLPDTKYQIPDTKYCLDNAAMIAAAGYWRWRKTSQKDSRLFFKTWENLEADANLKLKTKNNE
jgi:N6-L-threonylcarbamoyladenine synthase